MSKKTDKYSTKDESDELELISERLAADLRRSIRQLENYPILSDPWFEMADVFGRIASISDMESKLPSAKNEGTLWETEEQALRFLLEDGKLNLCLRNLIEFKQTQTRARKSGKGPILDFPAECDKFEKGLGTIMKNAWVHVEVLQTTDLPALINHIADVLEAALETPSLFENLIRQGDIHQRQEILVFYYLNGLLKHMDEIREHRFMPLIRERGILMLAVRVLCCCSSNLLRVHRLKSAEALAMLIDSEDFVTYKTQYIRGVHDVEKLVEMKMSCLTDLISSDYETKKLLRPLVDCIDRSKRQFRLK
eukprot:gene7382-10056_t